MNVTELRCNQMISPAGITDPPVFSWIPSSISSGKKQTAYQILLSENRESAFSESAAMWNSGKVTSSSSLWINYTGTPLRCSSKYYWRVRIWDENDNPGEWSKPAYLVTGLYTQTDWDNAAWIGIEQIPDSLLLVPGVHGNGDNLGNTALKRTTIPYLRKEFVSDKKIKQAFAHISGLGHYEMSINGKKIGDRFLSPGWTDYRKTCLYNTYEVTSELRRGKNAIGIIAGNGFYNINRERYRKLVIAFGAPKVIMKLHIKYTDGTTANIITDESWKASPSPITFTSIYGGEDYDARLEQKNWDKPGFDDSEWENVIRVDKPEGDLKPEKDYPVMVMQTINPVNIINYSRDTFVYDFGQNASGIVSLTVRGKPGQEIKIIPGELLGNDSLVTQKATGDPYYFRYTIRGEKKENWTPKFSYYGFRYAEVRGAVPAGYPNPDNLPEILDLQFLHTRNSSPEVGSFRCSNELLNSIYELINWSIKSNLASVATDCPHREKLGWLEQTHLMGNSIRYIYDIRNLYNKIIDDMIEAQLDNGLVPDIAPEYVPFNAGFRDSPEWGSACIILPWDMYQWYGNIEVVKKAYPMMKKYLSYLESKADNFILSHGLGDWYDLGPKSPGEAQLTPKAVTATSVWYYDNKLMAEMATLTGNSGDAGYYRTMAEKIRIAFNTKFFDEKIKVYSTGSQTSYAMPLYFGMVDEVYHKEVADNLFKSILDNNKALTAGDIGYRYLLRALEQEGHSQLIYEMNSRTDVPGYGYQLSKGATSLTESWAALRYVSNNHMMLGHIMEWFFSGLGGIKQSVNPDGSVYIEISPEPVGDIEWAETSYKSVFGEISSSWKITDTSLYLTIKIPSNSKAVIILPQPDKDKISESGMPVRFAKGVESIETRKGKSLLKVSGGIYNFEAAYPEKNQQEKRATPKD